ncbi:MAG: cobalamin-dependent protein [Nannocystaceae bacterium]
MSDPQKGDETLAERYLRVLLEARRREATDLILGAVQRGETDVRRVYLEVFEPVLREVGRLWLANQISIAQEHFISATTQLVMSRLYPHIFTTQRRGLQMVAACAGPELHEIGLRMVADFFELEGWDTYYLGANLPADAIVAAVAERKADLLAISATMPRHIPFVREVIHSLRTDEAMRSTTVLVGGGAFAREAQWRAVGADGCARSAADAVALAEELCAGKPHARETP